MDRLVGTEERESVSEEERNGGTLACEEAGRKCLWTEERSGIRIARRVEENWHQVRRVSVISGCLEDMLVKSHAKESAALEESRGQNWQNLPGREMLQVPEVEQEKKKFSLMK